MAAENFTVYVTCGDLPGEIDLQWDSVPNAKSYIVQLCRNNGSKTKWQLIDIVIDSRYTVTGLKSKMIYGFRIAAIYKQGQGKWSETNKKTL